MASTYTDRIGLEKQGDGENANTWGLRLNTNVIDLVDEAVAGYETVNVSAATSVVLTDTDGVSNQARNLGLKFTGLLTADTTVTIPAQEKIYFIQNDTTGDYTLFLKPAGGTALSVVDSGRSMIVATDGSTINYLESVDLDVVATKDELAATSATLQTRIEAVSLTMATSIATVSSTLNTRITNVSAALTTRADQVSATARAGYTNASAMTSGTVASGRLSGTYSINVTGNSGSATQLQNARTIGGVSFNGTANINLPGVNTAGNQNTSGNAATATYATSAGTAGSASYASSAGNADTVDGYHASSLLNIVAQSLSQNGYIKFSNGLIIQWGRQYIPSSGGIITWPIAFPTACFTALGVDSTTQNATANMTTGGGTTGLTRTNWGGDVASSGTYNWIAIGH